LARRGGIFCRHILASAEPLNSPWMDELKDKALKRDDIRFDNF
jgi:hypothetical protein